MNRILTISLAAVAFSLVVSVCYLWGFWGTFDIDIMYYLHFSELLVLSSVSLLGICILSVLCISIASIFNLEKATEGNSSSLTALLRPELIYTLSLLAIIGIVIKGGIAQWLLLAIPFAFFLTTFIVFNGAVFNKLLDNKALFYVILIATLLPSLAFGYGKTQGLLIDTGTSYKQVIVNTGNHTDSNQDFRYLGKAGDYFFVQDGTTRQIVISHSQAQPRIVLSKSSAVKTQEAPSQ